jgi:hypothetical protein
LTALLKTKKTLTQLVGKLAKPHGSGFVAKKQQTVKDRAKEFRSTKQEISKLARSQRSDLSAYVASLDLKSKKSHRDISTRGCCTGRMPIVISDDATFEITGPGYYFLEKDEVFSPTADYHAIQILSDDVTVDLCGYTLTQGNDQAGVIGVLIGEKFGDPYNNVKVTNGTVQKFTDAGIFQLTAGSPPLSTEINISDLQVLDCGSVNSDWDASGIVIESAEWYYAPIQATAPNIAFRNVTLKNCLINRSVGNGGVVVAPVDGLFMENVQILETTDGSEIGFAHLVGLTTIGNNINLDKVNVNGLRGIGELNITAIDADEWDCFYSTNITVKCSTFNDTVATHCRPIFLYANENVHISNIQANSSFSNGFDNPDESSKDNDDRDCGNFIDRCNNVFIENSQFNDHRSTFNGQIAGAFLQGEDTDFVLLGQRVGQNYRVVNCQFNNIYGENSFIIQGVNNSLGVNHSYEGCQFNGSRGGTNSELVVGIHMSDYFQIEPAEGAKYLNCQFSDHLKDQGQQSSGESFVAGFVSLTNRNILFDSCEATNIHEDLENPDSISSGTYGFFIATSFSEPTLEASNGRNVIFKNCTVSDLSGKEEVIGFHTGVAINGYLEPERGLGEVVNTIVENCIVQRLHGTTTKRIVAGIEKSYTVLGNFFERLRPDTRNICVTGCKIVDVKSNTDSPSPRSAGILIEYVENPVLKNNIVNDCDRGILFSGSRQTFRLSETEEGAVTKPAVPVVISSKILSMSPNTAFWSPNDSFWVTQPGNIPNKIVSSNYYEENTDTLLNTLVTFNGTCDSNTLQIEPLTGIKYEAETFIVAFDQFFNVLGRVSESLVTGTDFNLALDTSILANVAVVQFGINLSGPVADPVTVETLGNVIFKASINNALGFSSVFNLDSSFVFGTSLPVAILPVVPVPTPNTFTDGELTIVASFTGGNNLLMSDIDYPCKWKDGQALVYETENSSLIGLTLGQTYYLIANDVYTSCGMTLENIVTNSRISGYQDDRTPVTSSAWVSNNAFNNGTTHQQNYDISWACKEPVSRGSLQCYPQTAKKAYNLSIVKGDECIKRIQKKHCKKSHHKHHKMYR